jgi:hypothetical protein
MKIKFTPVARKQLELVNGVPANPTGFILGSHLGQFRIIESVFPLFFEPGTIDHLYGEMVAHFGDKLLGVFFNHCEPFLSDWFIEDIVIRLQEPLPLFYYYDAEKKYVLLPA